MTTLTHQPVIAMGINAGKFRPITDLMLDRATALKQTIIELKRRGFTVIGGDIHGARPSVLIETSSRCQALIDSGEAHYNYRSAEYRKGQFLVGECHVVWIEQGH